MERDTTEKRLDDLNAKVDRGFDRLDADVRDLRAEMKAGFDSVKERFEAMHRLMIQVGGGLIGTLIVASAGLIATQL